MNLSQKNNGGKTKKRCIVGASTGFHKAMVISVKDAFLI